MLVNIDNGGTLTDICVTDGGRVWRTKTLTTPHDLSQCLIDGLRSAAAAVYGDANLERLLLNAQHIRYSTTQGTNALVQRKGPGLGLLHDAAIDVAALRAANGDLFDALVGDRTRMIGAVGDAGRYDAVAAISDMAAAGANRIVIAFGGTGREAAERTLKTALLRAFPPHLLGALPLLYSHEIGGDSDDGRRSWTALFNAFLHPAMEQFLYAAEQRLREAKAQRPLLIFRNDGQSARVAKTTAIKTYSSGPRGGADGAQVLARHYGIDHLVSLDIGGTTTDISAIDGGDAQTHRFGSIEGVATSIALTAVASIGVGGSSVICVVDGAIKVGPQSVGSAPGPASFGLGGTEATITDTLFASGLLDAATFFGGGMAIDVERARAAVIRAVGDPQGLDQAAAVVAIEDAWVQAVAHGIRQSAAIGPDAVLAAFGGGGPLLICRIADEIGVRTILIPKLAAVFSAFGIGFSDIGHSFEAPLSSLADMAGVQADLSLRARRTMAAEGIDPAHCEETAQVVALNEGGERVFAADDPAIPSGEPLALRLSITHMLPHPDLSGAFAPPVTIAAPATGQRAVQVGGGIAELPVYAAAALTQGSGAAGPAVLEEEYFTCRIDAGWQFVANAAGDIFITRSGS